MKAPCFPLFFYPSSVYSCTLAKSLPLHLPGQVWQYVSFYKFLNWALLSVRISPQPYLLHSVSFPFNINNVAAENDIVTPSLNSCSFDTQGGQFSCSALSSEDGRSSEQPLGRLFTTDDTTIIQQQKVLSHNPSPSSIGDLSTANRKLWQNK